MRLSPRQPTSGPNPPAKPRVSFKRALAAGLAASLLNSVAIRIVKMTAVPPGTGGLSKMVLAQVDRASRLRGIALNPPVELGPLAQEVFHTSVGMVMALVHAVAFQRWLPGSR